MAAMCEAERKKEQDARETREGWRKSGVYMALVFVAGSVAIFGIMAAVE